MSVSWNTIIRQVTLRINALGLAGTAATTPADIQTAYATVPLTSNNFYTSIFSFGAIKDACINGESKLVTAVANQGNHPYRKFLTSQTAALTYGAGISTTDSGLSSKVIGAYGAVRDSTSGDVLTKGNLSQIRARVKNPNTMFLVDVPLYAINDDRVYHTVTSVVIDVCTYTRPASDSLVLTTNITLPDDAAPVYVQAALEECVRDDEFMAQGARFGEQFSRWVAGVNAFNSVDTISTVLEKAV